MVYYNSKECSVAFPFDEWYWKTSFYQVSKRSICTIIFLRQTPATHKREDRGFTLYLVFPPCRLSSLKCPHTATVLIVTLRILQTICRLNSLVNILRILIRQDFLKVVLSTSIICFCILRKVQSGRRGTLYFCIISRISAASVGMPILSYKKNSKPLKYRQGPLFSTTSKSQPGPRTV